MFFSSGNWWSSLSPSAMVRHVKVWTESLSVILLINPVPRHSAANMLLVLQTMYNVSITSYYHFHVHPSFNQHNISTLKANRSKKIPESTFYTKTQQTFLQEDLYRWRLMLKYKVVQCWAFICSSAVHNVFIGKTSDMVLFFLQCENDLPLIIGSFTFVMNLNSKKWVFDTLSAWTQVTTMCKQSCQGQNALK